MAKTQTSVAEALVKIMSQLPKRLSFMDHTAESKSP
jgi:hypothetical protein